MSVRLIAWLEAARQWGPAVPVAIVFALALVEAVALPRRLWAKGIWIGAVVISGMLATGALHRQERARDAILSDQRAAEIAGLQGLWGQLDALAQTLPDAGEPPAASFGTVNDGVASLSAKIAAVERQIAVLSERSKHRTIDEQIATKLADYLRQYGSFPVVVSCVPDDIEAYNYATQLANILRAAGWDAHGPEATAADVRTKAMGITVFVRDPHSPGAARILLDAFTRFNIPHQTGIAASQTILDTATVELFVARKEEP